VRYTYLQQCSCNRAPGSLSSWLAPGDAQPRRVSNFLISPPKAATVWAFASGRMLLVDHVDAVRLTVSTHFQSRMRNHIIATAPNKRVLVDKDTGHSIRPHLMQGYIDRGDASYSHCARNYFCHFAAPSSSLILVDCFLHKLL
jgi:hypothetical protein